MIDLANIFVRYEDGESLRQIGHQLGLDHKVISAKLQKAGYKINSRRRAFCVVTKKCLNCGAEFTRQRKAGCGGFCSKTCYNDWRAFHKFGADSKELTRKNYLKVRAEVLKEFPECIFCGTTDRLHVHHIIPRREIPDEYKSDRRLLITLCIRCHCQIKGKERRYLNYFASLISKGGELLESLNVNTQGNQQPSQSNVISIVDWKVQRLTGEDTQTNKPDTSAAPERDDIVRAYAKA